MQASATTIRDLATLAATAGGVLIGALGLYLNYRSRAATFRDRLHGEQLRILTESIETAFECYVGAAHCLSAPDNTERVEKIRAESWDKVAALQKTSFKASAVLPETTARALYTFVAEVNRILAVTDKNAPVPSDSKLQPSYWAFVTAARDELGIDALSAQTKDLLFGPRLPTIKVITK